MTELEHEQTFDEIMNQINGSILVVKKYKSAMKNSLLAIKRCYASEDFIDEVNDNNLFYSIAEQLKCDLLYNYKTKMLKLQSKLDKDFYVSVKLVSRKDYFNYLEKIQKKERV